MFPVPRIAHHVARNLSRGAYVRQTPFSTSSITRATPRRPPPPPSKSRPVRKSTLAAVEQPIPKQEPPETPELTDTLRNGPPRYVYVIGFTFICVIGAYTALIVNAAWTTCDDINASVLEYQKDVAARYDETADGFDSEVGLSERVMGIIKNRKSLTSLCRGHVLEASCGTGRNLGYFNLSSAGQEGGIKSLTFLDLSPAMVEVCQKKWDILYAGSKKVPDDLPVRFITGSAVEAMPPPPAPEPNTKSPGGSTAAPPQKYDTILQTMGLCSTPKPTELIINLAAHLNTSNPDARIYLLEHGRSYKAWMNSILDNSATKHAEIHGCWYNRDIDSVVREACARSGLEIKRERRRHFGTTYIFELGAKAPSIKGEGVEVRNGETVEPPAPKRGWFGSLWS